MRTIKNIIWWFAVLLLVGSLLVLKFYSRSSTVEDGAAVNTCDYFNGKVLEVTAEYLYVEPTEDWEWHEVSRVKIPLKSVQESDLSEWKIGDIIRVAYNSSAMEWGDDEVSISIVFSIFMMSDKVEDEAKEA